MAATATVVAQFNSTSAGAQTGTSSPTFTPAANTKLVVLASCLNNNHTTAKSWSISGGSLSWTIDSTSPSWEMALGANFDNQMILAWADIGASPPSNMSVVVDAFSGTDSGWYGITVYEVSGSTPGVLGNIQAIVFVDGGASAPALTLGSAKTANSVLLAAVHAVSDGAAPAWAADPGGWTVATKPTGTDAVNVSSLNSTTDSDASLTGYGTTSNTSDMVGAIVEIGEAVAALSQLRYRFGADDGSESTHTFIAAENTAVNLAASDARLLRIQIDETVGAGTVLSRPTWQYRQVGDPDGEWRDIKS